MNKSSRRQTIQRFFVIQSGLATLIAVISGLAGGMNAALSSALGGLVSIIPGMIFALMLFRYQGARAAKHIVSNFYKGEALKIVLSMILFAVVFTIFDVRASAFFISFILVQLTYWFAPWIFLSNRQ